MKTGETLSTAYFDDIYNKNDDPWNFQTSEYEKGKYQATVNALQKSKYQNAFEIGCSIGVLTEMLAGRCNKLLSVDVSEMPLEKARKRLADYPQVRFAKMALPREFPEETFDLIIMSEVGYYFSPGDLEVVKKLILEHLSAGGQLLMVHWTPIVHDYPLTGDEVHDSFLKLTENNAPLRRLFDSREKKYRIDLLEKL